MEEPSKTMGIASKEKPETLQVSTTEEPIEV